MLKHRSVEPPNNGYQIFRVRNAIKIYYVTTWIHLQLGLLTLHASFVYFFSDIVDKTRHIVYSFKNAANFLCWWSSSWGRKERNTSSNTNISLCISWIFTSGRRKNRTIRASFTRKKNPSCVEFCHSATAHGTFAIILIKLANIFTLSCFDDSTKQTEHVAIGSRSNPFYQNPLMRCAQENRCFLPPKK